MGSLSDKAIRDICTSEQEALGEDYVDLVPTLKQAITVGDLRKALEGVSDDLPVALELMVDHDGQSWFSESGFAVLAYETEAGVTGPERFLLNAVLPEQLEEFMAEFTKN